MWQCCSSNGYIENFIEHERRRVSLRINHISLIGTRWENENLLHHVEDFFRPIEPNIVVWDCHRLEGDLLCILEIGVWPPDPVEPFYGQKLVFPRHIWGEPQPVIIPLLSKEYVRNICLKIIAVFFYLIAVIARKNTQSWDKVRVLPLSWWHVDRGYLHLSNNGYHRDSYYYLFVLL